MVRLLAVEGDAYLWNVVQDLLKGEGHTVCEACNEYEGLPQEDVRLLVALPPQGTRYLIAL